MAKARVELSGCLSHTARGRTFKKGQPQVITSAADIVYYKAQPEYAVQMLDDEAPPVKTKAKALAPPPDLDEEEGGDEDGHHTDDEHDEEVAAVAGATPALPSKAAKMDKKKAK